MHSVTGVSRVVHDTRHEALLQHARHRYNQLRVAYDLVSGCKGFRVLDLGCGRGLLEEYFSDLDCTGLDIDFESLKEAQKRVPSAKFALADFLNLPARDEYADIVTIIAALGGIPSGQEGRVFEEASRALKPAGHLVILVSQACQPYSLLVPDRLFGGWTWRHFKANDLRDCLKMSGFHICKIAFLGGIISLGIDLLNHFWNKFRRLVNTKLPARLHLPGLPVRVVSQIEKVEFLRCGVPKRIARYIYIVAQKTGGHNCP